MARPIAERPKAFWEHAVLTPYRVVTFPVATVTAGIGGGIAYLDEHRVLERAVSLLGPRRGPFGFLLDLRVGGLSGFGGGLVAEHTRFFGPGNTLRIRASSSTRHDDRLGAAARFGGARGGFVEFGAGYRQRPNVRYFGIGPDTREKDESFFHQESAWLGASVRRPFGATSHLQGDLLYSTIATGAPGKGDKTPTEVVFAGDLPPGYGHHSYGITAGGQWMHESPGLQNRPGRGGIQRLRATYFESIDRDQVAFWTFRTEAQQFFTLWRPYRILALRGVASWIEDVGSDPVPFDRLNTNDDPDLLRGYKDFRWRDRGLAVATAEYRWPVWAHQRPYGPGADGYLLTDVGQVFGDADELGLNRVTTSFGGGLRIESGHGLVFRAEYARSNEGGVIRLRADQVFQFAKGGLINGREPIPDR